MKKLLICLILIVGGISVISGKAVVSKVEKATSTRQAALESADI